MRVALYVRVASANQLSFDAQLAYLRKYAEEHNYEVAAIFALNGVSGMKAENYLDAVRGASSFAFGTALPWIR